MWLTFFDVEDFDVVVINIHMERFFATYNFKNNLYFKNIDNLSHEDIILKNHTKKTSKSWKRLKLDHLIYVTWHLGSNKKLLKQRTGFIKHRHYANFDDNTELVNLLKNSWRAIKDFLDILLEKENTLEINKRVS